MQYEKIKPEIEKGLTELFPDATLLRSSGAPARMYAVCSLVFPGVWGCGERTFAIELLLSNGMKALDKIPSVEGKDFKMGNQTAAH